MTKLNEYFDNELSAQEQLEIQMWLAEHGDSPDSEAQLAELFDSLHIDDDAAARAAFGRVAHRLGIAGGQPSAPSRRARIVAWSQRIAAILVVPLLCAVWLLYADRKPEAEWLEQQVPYGEMASLTLPDGTQLHLNSGSRITYPSAFTGKERRIFVEGEIFADVAKDPRKPFIIQSGEVGIRVLGTRFNFKSYANTDCIEVLLVEGSVRFDIDAPTRKQQLTMKPGDMVQYDRATGDIDLTTFQPGHFKSFADDRAIHFFSSTCACATSLRTSNGCSARTSSSSTKRSPKPAISPISPTTRIWTRYFPPSIPIARCRFCAATESSTSRRTDPAKLLRRKTNLTHKPEMPMKD